MGFVMVLLVGGVTGWLASIALRTQAQQELALNVAVGALGAVASAMILSPLIGGAQLGSGGFDAMALVASALGAATLLSLANLFRRDVAP
jgi:uncharacterized membrane protein YeaQ/YmgE (transglycosylase-associated protein family)